MILDQILKAYNPYTFVIGVLGSLEIQVELTFTCLRPDKSIELQAIFYQKLRNSNLHSTIMKQKKYMSSIVIKLRPQLLTQALCSMVEPSQKGQSIFASNQFFHLYLHLLNHYTLFISR
jgi:hypothetical protein